MNKLRKHKWTILSSGLILTLILLTIWLIPSHNTVEQSQKKHPDLASSTPSMTSTHLVSDTDSASSQSISQQDTEINCQLSLNQAKNLIVDEKTKNCFEYFISQYGEKSLGHLKNDFKHYIHITYQEPLISQVIDLWERYLQYREQLTHIAKPELSSETSDYYRKIFDDILQLKQQFFSAYEIEGLFGTEDIYHQYTLDRMDIYNNSNLNEVEKAKQLKELLQQLPEVWQENIKQLSQLEDLRKLTQELKQNNGTAEQLKAIRLNLVGSAATERLEKLDVQRQDWKNRVTEYLNQRETIINSTMSEAAKQQSSDALRQQYFKDSQEQLRIHTFEQLKDQGQPLPFPD